MFLQSWTFGSRLEMEIIFILVLIGSIPQAINLYSFQVPKMAENPDNSGKQARSYQVELLNQAIGKNSIIYLGTGAGKTFIATMLIKELSYGILNDGKKTVFLAHRVPLVTQQSRFIAQNTSLTVRSFSGGDDVDFWSRDKWIEEIKKHQV